MSQSLSRWQAIMLGLVVVMALLLGGFGVARIAEKQGLWADSFEVTAGFPDAHDLVPGTPVRIRGVDAGQVVAVQYPDYDGPVAEVTVRIRLNTRYAERVYQDATAQIRGSGLLGPKIIAVHPGTPARGVTTGHIRGVRAANLEEVVADARKTAEEVRSLAAEAKQLVHEVRTSNGTIMKLIQDDDLHRDAKAVLTRTDKAIGALEGEVAGLHLFIQDGRDTLRSVKQGTDAIGKMPIVRSYVEDAAAILVRPAHHREMWYYSSHDLFDPNTALLHYDGQVHLNNLANLLKENRHKKSQVVVASFVDPTDKSLTPAAAHELAKAQAERVINHLRACEVHKLGMFSRRTMTPLGIGMSPNPVIEKQPMPATVVQVLLFTPQ